MKAQTANLLYRTMCLRIVPVSGTTIRLTQYPRELKMSNGQVYQSTVGYEFTGYSATDSLSPSVVDLEGIAGFAGIGKDEIASGVFDNARCYLFAVEWNNPVEDYEPIICSILGKTTLLDDRYKIEEMALVDLLNQAVGRTYTAACPKKFGGTEFAGCKKVPTTVTGTITSVTSQTVIQDSARTEALDFFGEGTIRFTSGLNAGLKKLEIKGYAANGTVTVHEPFYFLPSVGDSYEMVEGCRKKQSDCIAKGNILNFGGDPFIPATSQYVERGLN